MFVKKFVMSIRVLLISIISIMFWIIIIFSMLGYANIGLEKHYSKDSSYEAKTIVIEEILSYPEDEVIIFCIEGDYNRFKITDLNYYLAIENGILEAVKVGDEIDIIYGKGDFGDGWQYPIVQIEKDGLIYLEKEVAKEILVSYWMAKSKTYIRFYIITFSILGLSVGAMFLSIYFEKRKKRMNW